MHSECQWGQWGDSEEKGVKPGVLFFMQNVLVMWTWVDLKVISCGWSAHTGLKHQREFSCYSDYTSGYFQFLCKKRQPDITAKKGNEIQDFNDKNTVIFYSNRTHIKSLMVQRVQPMKRSALERRQASVNPFHPPKRDSVTSNDTKMLHGEAKSRSGAGFFFVLSRKLDCWCITIKHSIKFISNFKMLSCIICMLMQGGFCCVRVSSSEWPGTQNILCGYIDTVLIKGKREKGK